MEFKFNPVTNMYELNVEEFFIEYSTSNEEIYLMKIVDHQMIEDVEVMATRDEFLKIINNPRVAFYI